MSTRQGRQAEDAACRYLKRQGYHVIDRNCRLGRGELDIVALKGDILVFVEVKAHRKRAFSLQAMHQDKQERVVSAAQAWLGLHPQYASYQCRFDLLMVVPAKLPLMPQSMEHMRDIIRL